MIAIKILFKEALENYNIIPYKVVNLSTGVVCEHYKNGTVKVLN